MTTAAARPLRTLRAIASAVGLLLVLGVALGSLGLASDVQVAAAGVLEDEGGFVSLINSSRAASGRGPLSADPAAADLARSWSREMASAGRISHNPNLRVAVDTYVTRSWSRIGENVGVGYGVSSLHDAFMASEGHRANILGDYNRVGVGVVRESSGKLWVTVVFIKGPTIASAPVAAAWTSPAGALDGAWSALGGVRVSGWALDPDTTGTIEVHVYVGDVGTVLRADGSRPDVGAAYPRHGSAHGFATMVRAPSAPGSYPVCAYAINVGPGANSLLGCRNVRVDRNPVGSLDRVTTSTGRIDVAGWTLDPDVTGAVDVHVWVGGVGTVLKADRYRGDLASAFPAYGGSHGFGGSVGLPAASGRHDLCAYGINQASGSNILLGCRTVTVRNDPTGSLDLVRRADGSIRVAGWALDPNTSQPIQVHVYAGAAGAALEATASRGDIAQTFPGFGDRHGFDVVIPDSSGLTTVCAYGINVGPGGNALLGCRRV